jgi:hypothetical protein
MPMKLWICGAFTVKKKLLAECLRIAEGSLHKHPQLEHYPHWAFIVQGNKIVEWSTNLAGEPPIHFGYHDKIKGATNPPKMHAEFAAFRKARGILESTKPFECINIRMNKTGEIRFAAPCNCCRNFLNEMGCVSFWFTTCEGWEKT